MSEFVEQQITLKCPADGQQHSAKDDVAWTEREVSAMVNEGIGLAYYPTRLNGETIYRVAHLASGKAISQPAFSAHSPEQAECWIYRLCQDIDWTGDFPCLRLTSSPELLMGYAVVGQLSYAEHSCSICHEFSDDLKELADLQLCEKCYAPPRDGNTDVQGLATTLYRFMLALIAIVKCAAYHAEVDLEASPHFEIFSGPCGGHQVIVTVGGYDVFMTRRADGMLVPGFVWTHGDAPYAFEVE